MYLIDMLKLSKRGDMALIYFPQKWENISHDRRLPCLVTRPAMGCFLKLEGGCETVSDSSCMSSGMLNGEYGARSLSTFLTSPLYLLLGAQQRDTLHSAVRHPGRLPQYGSSQVPDGTVIRERRY